MSKLLLLLCCGASLLPAATDAWEKVRKLPGRAELRVYKKGSVQPLLVKFGELTDDRLVIIDKNQQTSIAKEDIDRIDARASGKRPVTHESTTTTSDHAADPHSPQPGISTTTSSGVSFGNRPDFETVYRRPPPAPRK